MNSLVRAGVVVIALGTAIEGCRARISDTQARAEVDSALVHYDSLGMLHVQGRFVAHWVRGRNGAWRLRRLLTQPTPP